MAVPHYSYLVLKMPTEKGLLTFRGNVYATYTCEEESFKVTVAIDLSIQMAETMSQAAQALSNQLKVPKQQNSGKNYVRGVNGVRPRCQVRVLTLANCHPWGCGTNQTRELVLSCAKGDLRLLLQSIPG